MRRPLLIKVTFNLIIRGHCNRSRVHKTKAVKTGKTLVRTIKILSQDIVPLLKQLDKIVLIVVPTLTYLKFWQHIWKAEDAVFEMLSRSGLNIFFGLALLVWLFKHESK